MKITKLIIFFFIVLLNSLNLITAKAAYLETTRLKGTAGAGVASILFEESTILNPAAIAFYNNGSLYYDKGISLDQKGLQQKTNTVIASDASSQTKGSILYSKSSSSNNRNASFTQYAISMAKIISKNSSIGISYINYISNNNNQESSFKDFSIGFTKIISVHLILGLLAINPNNNTDRTKLLTGFQYQIQDSIVFMLDVGANFKNNLSKSFLYRTALQIRFMNNFYLRYGISKDLFLKQQRNGIGVSWSGPRLSLEFASLNTSQSNQLETLNYKETSFAVSLAF